MTQQKADNVFTIVLLGVTGAGKSTFASIASGKQVKIGHGVDPCTQDPLAVTFEMGDQSIVLIDTPGFDDDTRSDVEILRDIAEWLGHEGFISKHRPLDGLILLHPATHTKISRNERKRSRLLEKILGQDAYSRVVIATTMWENLPDQFEKSYNSRTDEAGPWHSFRTLGATVTKHNNTPKSAHDIIRTIISNAAKQKWGPRTKSPGLLNSDLANPLGDELRLQLEEDADLAARLLRDHKKHRPTKEGKKSKDLDERRKYQIEEHKWRLEKQELEENLDARQKQVKRMDRTIVSCTLFNSPLYPYSGTLDMDEPLTSTPHSVGR
ncbi:GTP-binding protein A [Podospora aff. communis PSN243]|uniref:GTP-binding protein A n=1 Tax=Podospora aff. communis PSN243 TaxID=3040156 RepID=A0AAV9GNU1_9PEZI|nr:GTP-binding protein A [Podospora aff. communis PSN243]